MRPKLTVFKHFKTVWHGVLLVSHIKYDQAMSLIKLGWSNLAEQRQHRKAIMMFKFIKSLTPSYLSYMFTRSSSLSDYGLRSSRMNIEFP